MVSARPWKIGHFFCSALLVLLYTVFQILYIVVFHGRNEVRTGLLLSSFSTNFISLYDKRTSDQYYIHYLTIFSNVNIIWAIIWNGLQSQDTVSTNKLFYDFRSAPFDFNTSSNFSFIIYFFFLTISCRNGGHIISNGLLLPYFILLPCICERRLVASIGQIQREKSPTWSAKEDG